MLKPIHGLAGLLMVLLAACNLGDVEISSGGAGSRQAPSGGELAEVVRIIDGDTIDVRLNGTVERVRYVGVNTPERDEACYREAVEANRRLVEGQMVRLARDVSERDRFDRLLRYVYVGETFVNRELIVQGYAEVVRYDPDSAYWEEFRDLEQAAARAGRGCHPTGIFNDGSYTR